MALGVNGVRIGNDAEDAAGEPELAMKNGDGGILPPEGL